jgi:predicted RNA binding protein YcfA (HicA-like mRNA interferase family)/predicted RNase H-like HicB family nuclease
VKTFSAYVAWDPQARLYVGIVPGIPGAHTQGARLDELNLNLKEVLGLCLEEYDGEPDDLPHFVGLQQVEVAVRADYQSFAFARWRKCFFGCFQVVRQKGSHILYQHPDGRTTTLPNHSGPDLARPLIREILREIELTPADFQSQLKDT